MSRMHGLKSYDSTLVLLEHCLNAGAKLTRFLIVADAYRVYGTFASLVQAISLSESGETHHKRLSIMLLVGLLSASCLE